MLKLTTKKTRWFVVPQDTTGETKVLIKHLKPGEVAELESKVNKITGKQQGDDFFTEINFALHDRTKAFVVQAVEDWEGILGTNDKKLPCNDVNKLTVFKEFSWFGEFVEDCRKALADEVEAESEGAEKN